MTINFEYHDVAASPRLEAFVSERLNKLENKYDFVVSADVYFKNKKSSNPEEGKICKIRLNTPGVDMFAETSSSSFEASIAKVMTDLRTQLQRRKDKLKSH